MTHQATYFPPPEAQGGWRYLKTPAEVHTLAQMDPNKLNDLRQFHEYLYGGASWGIVIIRHGYLVREFYTFNVVAPTRFDVWSCTKTLTGTAWGLLLEESRQGKLPNQPLVTLDSPAYAYIPDGYPLTDERKAQITIGHLLSMTSGIAGENEGLFATPTASDQGPFEYALGRAPNRFGKWVDKLVAEPGTVWNYSDPAFAHLSLAFAKLAGVELSAFLEERLLKPIGIENLSWDQHGGSGFLGPHTAPHTGAHISARELARFGYLALHHGVWNEQQIIPRWWQELATNSSQPLNPSYGYTWWTNAKGTQWPSLPKDAFGLAGYASNRCYVIPSLDLVVARVGTGPSTWDEPGFIGSVVGAILPEA